MFNQFAQIFIFLYTENGKTMLIDVDNKSREDILEHLLQVVGKTKEVLQQESIREQKKDNPANFGVGCSRSCMCTIPGQVPCPSTVPLPFHMRNKTRNIDKTD